MTFLLFSPSYEAVAWLRIDARQPYIAFEDKSESQETDKIFAQSQVQLLRSPMVLGPVLADPRIARLPEIAAQTDPVDWLSKQIIVKQVGDSELHQVIYTSHDPKAAVHVVNAVVDQYFRLHSQENSKRSEDVIKILAREKDNRAQELLILRRSVQEMAIQATGKDPYGGNSEPVAAVNHPLADVQKALVLAEVEQEVLKARIKVADDSMGRLIEISDSMVERKMEEHPEIIQLRQNLNYLRAQINNRYPVTLQREKEPAYSQRVQEIADTERSIQILQKELRGKIREDLQLEAAEKRNEQIAALKAELENRRITAELLREKFGDQLKNIHQASGDTVHLRLKQAELQRAERIDELIAQRILELRTEKGAPERVTLLKMATPSTEPIDAPYDNMLWAALTGFTLPFLGLIVFMAISWVVSACFPVVKRQLS
jgi:uncharacterized protein involved in exopolysaccharide biosynthesis